MLAVRVATARAERRVPLVAGRLWCYPRFRFRRLSLKPPRAKAPAVTLCFLLRRHLYSHHPS